MTHDPLCPFWPQSADASCLWCGLIVKVREDERTKLNERINLGGDQ